MTDEVRFSATVGARPRGGVSIELPFDPNAAWGAKDRHYVYGIIERYGFRGVLTVLDGQHLLQLGPAWCRDPRMTGGARVSVVMQPEGPQVRSMPRDIAVAIEAEPDARRFFDSLATFYRKGFVDWIEEAKQPETRSKRIEATMTALRAGRRER